MHCDVISVIVTEIEGAPVIEIEGIEIVIETGGIERTVTKIVKTETKIGKTGTKIGKTVTKTVTKTGTKIGIKIENDVVIAQETGKGIIPTNQYM